MTTLSTGSVAGVQGVLTVADAFGQVVWLLSQSPIYRELRVREVEHAFLPAILAKQFRIFRMGDGTLTHSIRPGDLSPEFAAGLETTPLGLAVWARLSAEAEASLEGGNRLAREDWSSGERLWLIELVSPFADAENRLQDIMLLDLLNGPFKGEEVRLHRTDPSSGLRQTIVLPSTR